MTLPDDFREFLRCLNAHSVRYLVTGGHAVSFHGYPRFTSDIDVVIVSDPENARAILDALEAFGFGGLGLKEEDFLRQVTVVLGRAPHEIDVMTYLKGVDLGAAWAQRVSGVLDGVDVFFVSKEHLVANKKAVGRPEDMADVERLRDDRES